MDERWERVRQIVREECERITERLEKKIIEAAQANRAAKHKIKLVNGRWEGVTPEVMQALKEAYPAVDVEGQLKEMIAWIFMHPEDAPKSNYGAFIQTWLKKHQDRHSIRSIPLASVKTDPKAITPSLCEYCLKPARGSVNGIRYCGDHGNDAMDMKPRPKMPGVVAKAVAGND